MQWLIFIVGVLGFAVLALAGLLLEVCQRIDRMDDDLPTGVAKGVREGTPGTDPEECCSGSDAPNEP